MTSSSKLRLLPYNRYTVVDHDHDPLRFYHWPVIGQMYRRRVELCLAECKGGGRILEIGFGSGVTFLNLNDMYNEIHGLELGTSVEAVTTLFRSVQIETHLRRGSVLEMPYPDDYFDTVLSISILEHLKPESQFKVFQEICRVLKLGGQTVYGVPIERPLMVLMFRLLGYDIREHHFSTERDVSQAANKFLDKVKVTQMKSPFPFLGPVYEVGHFCKA